MSQYASDQHSTNIASSIVQFFVSHRSQMLACEKVSLSLKENFGKDSPTPC